MRIDEFAKKKKIETIYDPIEAARESLEYYKKHGTTVAPNGTLQLFIPRKVEIYTTKKEREDYLLRDRAKYSYDDEGNLTDWAKNYIETATESRNLNEAAPVIAGGSPVLPGHNKPVGAILWTSTAKKLPNGKWTSGWNKFIQSHGMGDLGISRQSKIGYLYKVKPNTVVYELDSTNDAKIIYEIFEKLGRGNSAYSDPAEWKRIKEYGSPDDLIRKDFPWQELQKHFDCVHHYNFGSYNYDGIMQFTYGYDCESSCWLKSDQLELLGQVPIFQGDEDQDDDEY